MIKDIIMPKVEGVNVAIARKKIEETNDYDWNVYIINKNNFSINNILITSKGYGFKDEEKQETSVLRHMIPIIEAKDFALVERIDPSVFHLYNQYWVSYYVDKVIHEKKFIFVPESIIEENLVKIGILELNGILHE